MALTAAARLVAGRRPSAEGDPGRDVWLVHGLGSTGRGTFDGSGWLRALEPFVNSGDAPARVWLVELPGHPDAEEAAADPEAVTASAPWIGDAVRELIEAHSAPRAEAGDEPWRRAVIGYSFGGRLAWEAADVVDRVVIGGLPRTDPAHDERHQVLAAAGLNPAENPRLAALLDAITARPFAGANPPRVPTLIAYGEKDEIAQDAHTLVELVPGAEELVIPGRNHLNAVSSRKFKDAALALLDG